MRPAISIAPNALRAIETVIAKSDPRLETGGALFGHEGALVVTFASGPGQNAVHQPGYFLRDLDHAQHAADQAFKKDRSQWIGEWHTHPSGPRQPSPMDLNTYISHLVDPELRFDRFVALIGSMNARPELEAWLLSRSGEGIELRRTTLTVLSEGSFDRITPG